jgi:hypothetical protein
MTQRALVFMAALSAALLATAVRSPLLAGEDSAAPKTAAASRADLSACTWLAGTWSGQISDGTFEARYSLPQDGMIMSFSRLIKEGEVAFHEFEIFDSDEQSAFLQPYPGGKPAARFRLVSHDPQARRLVFENPQNDFPTRIVYERPSDDRLVITLNDPHSGSEKVEIFDLTKR